MRSRGRIFELLPEELNLVTHTALLLNLSGDVIYSMNDCGVGPIEGPTDAF
jgi:hypothetical protein